MRQLRGTSGSLFPKVLIAASAISLLALAVSGAPASNQRPHDQVATCREALAKAKDNLAFARRLEKEADAGRIGLLIDKGVPVLVDVALTDAALEILPVPLPAGLNKLLRARIESQLAEALKRARRVFPKLRASLEQTVARLTKQCGAVQKPKPPAPKPPPPAAGSFALTTIKVDPPQLREWTIDAQNHMAMWIHPQDGGRWNIEYTFEVPDALTPGHSYPIKLGIKVTSYESGGPSTFVIGVRNEGIQDADPSLSVSVNGAGQWSKTLTLFVPESYKDAPDSFTPSILITSLGPAITYTYHRVG